MPTTIDKDRAIQDLRELVAEVGEDFVYHGIGYAEENKPAGSCAIGRVLFKEGVSYELLQKFDCLGVNIGSLLGFWNCLPDTEPERESQERLREAVTITAEAGAVFGVFQFFQDSHIPYGQCMQFALRVDLQAGYLEKGGRSTLLQTVLTSIRVTE